MICIGYTYLLYSDSACDYVSSSLVYSLLSRENETITLVLRRVALSHSDMNLY